MTKETNDHKYKKKKKRGRKEGKEERRNDRIRPGRQLAVGNG